MSTATTSIAGHADSTCATATKDANPYTPQMHTLRHATQARLLLAALELHRMDGQLSTDGLDDAFNLLTMALHDLETLRSWYLYDLKAATHPTTEGRTMAEPTPATIPAPQVDTQTGGPSTPVTDKALHTLQARFALAGQTLNRLPGSRAMYATRWGMVRHLATEEEARLFLARIEGARHE